MKGFSQGNDPTCPVPAGKAQEMPRAPFPAQPLTAAQPGWSQPLTPSSWEQHTQVDAPRQHLPAAAATSPLTSLASLSKPSPTPGRTRQGPYSQLLSPHMHSSTPGEIEPEQKMRQDPQKTECKCFRTKNTPKKCPVSSGLPLPSFSLFTPSPSIALFRPGKTKSKVNFSPRKG